MSTYLWPPIVTCPRVAGVRPTMMRIVVDLPAPLGPRKPVTRPGLQAKDTSSTARKPPYVLETPSTVIMRPTLHDRTDSAHPYLASSCRNLRRGSARPRALHGATGCS